MNYSYLNSEEELLLKKIYLLPQVVEQVASTYKPHLLATHLFETATMINSWYSKYSVTNETDVNRKTALLKLCDKLAKHQQQGLELLGIETLESI